MTNSSLCNRKVRFFYSVSQCAFIMACAVISLLIILLKQQIIDLHDSLPSSLPVLSPIEERLLLNNYEYISKKSSSTYAVIKDAILTVRSQRIAFCCSSDVDVSVPAIQLMAQLEQKQLVTTSEIAPRREIKIQTYDDLVNSFGYYFKRGAATEQSMFNRTNFEVLVSLAKNLSGEIAIGGNAATMAQRAAIEGVDVFLSAVISDATKSQFHENVTFSQSSHLKYKAEKKDEVEEEEGKGKEKQEEEEEEKEDIHLVLEYARNESWKNIRPSRANRYYLNHDIHNSRLTALEEFDEAIDQFQPDLVVIGGLQLMEMDVNVTRREQRLELLSEVLMNAHLKGIPIHLELAAVSDFLLFGHIVENILPYVTSIGLNEQELSILSSYLIHQTKNFTSSSVPSLLEVTKQLNQLIQYANQAHRQRQMKTFKYLQRIHFHTLQFHVICQRKDSVWDNPKSALIQGALMSTKLACGNVRNSTAKLQKKNKDMSIDWKDVEVPLRRRSEIHGGRHVVLDPHNPVQTWEESDYTCHMVPMLVCKKAHRTAGLGDSISGIGLTYHMQKKES